MYKGLLNRELLRAEKGVKYFTDILRPTSSKGLKVCSPGDLISFTRARRGNIEMVKWIGNLSLLLKRLKDCWMDISPTGSSDSRVSDVGCGQNTSSHAHFSQSMSVPPALTALFFTFTRTCVAEKPDGLKSVCPLIVSSPSRYHVSPWCPAHNVIVLFHATFSVNECTLHGWNQESRERNSAVGWIVWSSGRLH